MLAIFNSLGGGEVIAILVIALIVLGPEKLPEAIRKFGNIYGELKRMSTGFQSELRDAFDEPLRELRGTAQMMQDAVNDPIQSVTQMKAPVVGGAAAAAAASAAATSAAAASPAESDQVDDEVQAPVDEQVTTAEPEEPEPAEVAAPEGADPSDAIEPPGDVVPGDVVPGDVVAPDGPPEQAG